MRYIMPGRANVGGVSDLPSCVSLLGQVDGHGSIGRGRRRDTMHRRAVVVLMMVMDAAVGVVVGVGRHHLDLVADGAR